MGYEYPCHHCKLTAEVTTVGSLDLCHACLISYVATLKAEVERLEAKLADAWYVFEPAYKHSSPDSGMDSADWWDLMCDVHRELQPEGGPA